MIYLILRVFLLLLEDYDDTYDNGNTDPDVSNPGVNLDNGSPDPEAARYDNNYGRDPCAGVSCPEIDCPTRPYIPQGECCPICPGGSQVYG